MIIAFLIDNYNSKTDGTNISATRFKKILEEHGHEVRIISIDANEPNSYSLKEKYIPLITWIAKKSSQRFAKFDKNIISVALEGVDILHCFLPWQLAKKTIKLAKKKGIPVSAAFHCQPENITYNANLTWIPFLPTFIFFYFRRKVYHLVDDIHCPSLFIAKELRNHHYRAKLHVISNGIDPFFAPPAKREFLSIDEMEVFTIAMVGRLAKEKRQDLLLKAVNASKYRDKIKIVFAGKGPNSKKIHKLAKKLSMTPTFDFLDKNQLLSLLHRADLYVHCADAEIEGMSCMEAFATGLVPIISDAPKAATSQFALSKDCLFKHGNHLDLKDKIERLMEDATLRKELSEKYAELGQKYSVEYSVNRFEKMLEEVIEKDHFIKSMKESKKQKKYYKKITRKYSIKKALGLPFYYLFVVPVMACFNFLYFDLRIKNRRALRKVKKGGAITICNHMHDLDATFVALAIFPRKAIYTVMPENLKISISGFLVDILGGVPTPTNLRELKTFIYAAGKKARSGRIVHFYPEGKLVPYNNQTGEFKKGAVTVAVNSFLPLVPMRIVYRQPKGIRKIIFRKKNPWLTVLIGDPLYPNYLLNYSEAVDDLKSRMEESYNNLSLTGEKDEIISKSN